MHNVRRGVGLWMAFGGMMLSGVALAQSTPTFSTPEGELKKQIRVSQDISPLGDNAFGEHVNLYNGMLSFEQADVDLPGNGLPIQLIRSFTIPESVKNPIPAVVSAGDWTIEIPHLETLVAYDQQANLLGWNFQQHGVPDTAPVRPRCSVFQAPDTVSFDPKGWQYLYTFRSNDWWAGVQMDIPGEGSRDLLRRLSSNTHTPSDGSTYPITTKDDWQVSCLSTTANGQPGEGFLATSPQGTKYWFDWLTYQRYTDIRKYVSESGYYSINYGDMGRAVALMLVTKIQDRFGNTLTYSYDSNAHLTSILASDGRQLTLSYESNLAGARLSQATVASAASGTRRWNYSYDSTGHLSLVRLPDSSAWTFANMAALLSPEAPIYLDDCSYDGKIALSDAFSSIEGQTGTATIIHPSGLTGTFTVKVTKRGRSYVPYQCDLVNYYINPAPTSGTATLGTLEMANLYAVSSLINKTYSGAGLSAESWNYNYSPSNESWTTDACASNSSCPTSVYTDVTQPNGSTSRYTFSNRFDAQESLLQRMDVYPGATSGSPLRSEVNTYASSTAGPWPSSYGDPLFLSNGYQLSQLSPLSQHQILQEGDTYTWLAEGFNVYAQVTQTKRSNSIAGQSPIEEATTYLNDTNLWVLGLPQQVTNLTTGEVESTNTYNTSNDTLLTRARFGQPLMSYTFNSAGQLASFTDGNSHTTSLSNYKRGIPQTIGYPDSTSETLAVDDFGQISAITDQAGHTTNYGYDSVGRITGITYPGGDEVAWLPKTFAYDFVTSDERGVSANHWRRTTTTGNAVGVTYFDAMLHSVLSDSAIGASVQASTLTTYDAKGQKIFSAYPSASALNFTLSPAAAGIKGVATTYDALERVTQVQQDSELGTLTSSTAYLSGARQQVTDPKGNVTTTSYQVFDQPSSDAVIQVQAPAGVTQTITRDLYGNPVAIRQLGSYNGLSGDVTKTLTYDAYHRLCRTTEPESGSEVMAYDGANNLAWSAAGSSITGTGCGQEQVAAAGKTVRSYDAMNRVLTLTPPSGTQSTTYAYDALGNISVALSGTTTWSASRNKLGQLTRESLQVNGQNPWTIGYQHDVYGNLNLISYPNGEAVNYAPDALGRATQVGSYASGIGYFPNGQVSQFVYSNGAAYVAEQNTRQMLSNFSYGTGGTPQLSEDLSYDANGNITTVTDLAGGPRSKSFGYDALNRLVSAQAGGLWGTETYTYDPLNNLRSRTGNGLTSTYNYDPLNRLGSISGGSTASFVYDNRGNVINKNGVALDFDQKNQLLDLPGHATYAYDAAGRRVSKTSNGGAPTYYFYTQGGQLLYQWDTAAGASTNFIYLGKKLVAKSAQVGGANTGGTGVSVLFPPAYSTTGSYSVSWYAIAGASSYQLQELVNGNWATIYTGSANAFGISGKANGTYQYQVRSCVGSSCGSWSATASVTVSNQSSPSTPVLSPLLAINRSNLAGNYTALWAGVDNASTYTLQEQFQSGAWSTVYSGPAASWDATNKPAGNYAYQVQACNSAGCGPWSMAVALRVSVDMTPIINLILD